MRQYRHVASYSIWVLEESNLLLPGRDLDGVTQGDGTHLIGRNIFFRNQDWIRVTLTDDDEFFDDNDGSQRLDGEQTIDGTTYPSGTRIEAEYTLILVDPKTGDQYTMVAFNVNDSSPAYSTVEGLAFVGEYPPQNVRLKVLDAFEGPGDFGNDPIPYSDFAVCFTPGARIATPDGPRLVETLRPGDLVDTRDHGPRPLLWVGATDVGVAKLRAAPRFRAVRIRAGALGNGRPRRDLVVSQQHRIMLSGWRIELLFGKRQVLAAAKHLVGMPGVTLDPPTRPLRYLHLLFDRHEIVRAEGLCVESFRPGIESLATLSAEMQAEVHSVLRAEGADAASFPPARPLLKEWETWAATGYSPSERNTFGSSSGRSSAISPGPKLRAAST